MAVGDEGAQGGCVSLGVTRGEALVRVRVRGRGRIRVRHRPRRHPRRSPGRPSEVVGVR